MSNLLQLLNVIECCHNGHENFNLLNTTKVSIDFHSITMHLSDMFNHHFLLPDCSSLKRGLIHQSMGTWKDWQRQQSLMSSLSKLLTTNVVYIPDVKHVRVDIQYCTMLQNTFSSRLEHGMLIWLEHGSIIQHVITYYTNVPDFVVDYTVLGSMSKSIAWNFSLISEHHINMTILPRKERNSSAFWHSRIIFVCEML